MTDTLKDSQLSMQESISAQIETIENALDRTQAASQMIDEIYQRAEEQNRALTEADIGSIGRLTEVSIRDYSDILGDTPEEASLIFEVLNEY